MRGFLTFFFAALFGCIEAAEATEDNRRFMGERMPYAEFDRLPATRRQFAGGELIVAFAPGVLELRRERVLEWVDASARAVAAYYGSFPAASARLLIVPSAGQGVSSGKAWNYRSPALRISMGGQTTEEQLRHDWILVHEMVHLAFAPVADRHNWIQEGLASYIEAVARAQVGQLTPEKVWGDLVAGLPKGLPQTGDRGLDHTPTWGRTYWGGALYCLLADLEIRRRTNNRLGLQHAMRAILSSGSKEAGLPLEQLLAIGDRAVGVPVLSGLYANMKDQPAPVDLDALWLRLGVRPVGKSVLLDESAPEAALRRAITARPGT